MKRLLVYALMPLFLSFYVSCDQDENLDDKWNSKESYSLSRMTRSGDIEPQPIEMLYILPGHEERKLCIKRDSAEINFDISWPGGFTYEHLPLSVSHSFTTLGDWRIKDFYITNLSLSTEKARFICNGKAVYNDSCYTISFLEEISVNVQSKMKAISSK